MRKMFIHYRRDSCRFLPSPQHINLLPLPPLDGSKILYGLAPHRWDLALYKLDRVGPPILMGLILMGFFVGFSPIWMIMSPFVRLFTLAFTGIPLNVLYSLIYS